MNDKLNITIRIANQAPIPLSINRDDEEVIRTAEFNVNKLWNAWSAKFKNKSSMEVLAMVAFRFAELFSRRTPWQRMPKKPLRPSRRRLTKFL